MFKKSVLFSFLVSLVFLPNCKNAEQKRLLEAFEKGAKIIDISPAKEFAKNNRKGSINIPLSQLGKKLAEVGPKDKPVILHSHSSGKGVDEAVALLKKAGFTRVLHGGGFQKLHMALDH